MAKEVTRHLEQTIAELSAREWPLWKISFAFQVGASRSLRYRVLLTIATGGSTAIKGRGIPRSDCAKPSEYAGRQCDADDVGNDDEFDCQAQT